MFRMSTERLPTEQLSKTLSLLISIGSWPNLNSIIRLSNSKWSSCCNRHWLAKEFIDLWRSFSWLFKWEFWFWIVWRRLRSSDGPFFWIFWCRRIECKRNRSVFTLQEFSISVKSKSASWILFGKIQGRTDEGRNRVKIRIRKWNIAVYYCDIRCSTW